MKTDWHNYDSSDSEDAGHNSQSNTQINEKRSQKHVKQQQKQKNKEKSDIKHLSDEQLIEQIQINPSYDNKKLRIVNCRSQEMKQKIKKHPLIINTNQINEHSYIVIFNTQENLIEFIQEKIKNKYRFYLKPFFKRERHQGQQRYNKRQDNKSHQKQLFFWKYNENYLYIREQSVAYEQIIKSISQNNIVQQFKKIRIYMSPKSIKWVFNLIDKIYEKFKFREIVKRQQLLVLANQCNEKYFEVVLKQFLDNHHKFPEWKQNYLYLSSDRQIDIIKSIDKQKLLKRFAKLRIVVDYKLLNAGYKLAQVISSHYKMNIESTLQQYQNQKGQKIQIIVNENVQKQSQKSEKPRQKEQNKQPKKKYILRQIVILEEDGKKIRKLSSKLDCFGKIAETNVNQILDDIVEEEYFQQFLKASKSIFSIWNAWKVKTKGVFVDKLIKISQKLRNNSDFGVQLQVPQDKQNQITILNIKPKSQQKRQRPKVDPSYINSYLNNCS